MLRKNDIKTVGLIGFGSIAKKHLAEIKKCKPDATVIIRTRQNIPHSNWPQGVIFTPSIDAVLSRNPDLIMVATPASEHADRIDDLAQGAETLIVEKPIAAKADAALRICHASDRLSQSIKVAYNLRYLEGLTKLKNILSSGTIGDIMRFEITAGQDLKSWRPGRDYAQSVSAQAAKGGGVLRELSHELDLAYYLFGAPHNAALMRTKMKYTSLDVEDTAQIEASFGDTRINGTIRLDFTRETPKRYVALSGSQALLEWNIITGEIIITHGTESETIFTKKQDLSMTYTRMWHDILNHKTLLLPDAHAGYRVLKWIEDMERNAPMTVGE